MSGPGSLYSIALLLDQAGLWASKVPNPEARQVLSAALQSPNALADFLSSSSTSQSSSQSSSEAIMNESTGTGSMQQLNTNTSSSSSSSFSSSSTPSSPLDLEALRASVWSILNSQLHGLVFPNTTPPSSHAALVAPLAPHSKKIAQITISTAQGPSVGPASNPTSQGTSTTSSTSSQQPSLLNTASLQTISGSPALPSLPVKSPIHGESLKSSKNSNEGGDSRVRFVRALGGVEKTSISSARSKARAAVAAMVAANAAGRAEPSSEVYHTLERDAIAVESSMALSAPPSPEPMAMVDDDIDGNGDSRSRSQMTGGAGSSVGLAGRDLELALEGVLSDLKAYDEHSFPFLTRVRKADAPDYYTVITKPMDLGTMSRKLKRHAYASAEEFAEDAHLIFDNCLEYNTDPESEYRTHAIAMRVRLIELLPIGPWANADPTAISPSDPSSLSTDDGHPNSSSGADESGFEHRTISEFDPLDPNAANSGSVGLPGSSQGSSPSGEPPMGSVSSSSSGQVPPPPSNPEPPPPPPPPEPIPALDWSTIPPPERQPDWPISLAIPTNHSSTPSSSAPSSPSKDPTPPLDHLQAARVRQIHAGLTSVHKSFANYRAILPSSSMAAAVALASKAALHQALDTPGATALNPAHSSTSSSHLPSLSALSAKSLFLRGPAAPTSVLEWLQEPAQSQSRSQGYATTEWHPEDHPLAEAGVPCDLPWGSLPEVLSRSAADAAVASSISLRPLPLQNAGDRLPPPPPRPSGLVEFVPSGLSVLAAAHADARAIRGLMISTASNALENFPQNPPMAPLPVLRAPSAVLDQDAGPLDVSPPMAHALLRNATAMILNVAGYDSFTAHALNTLTDAFARHIESLGRDLRTALDKAAKRRNTPPEARAASFFPRLACVSPVIPTKVLYSILDMTIARNMRTMPLALWEATPVREQVDATEAKILARASRVVFTELGAGGARLGDARSQARVPDSVSVRSVVDQADRGRTLRRTQVTAKGQDARMVLAGVGAGGAGIEAMRRYLEQELPGYVLEALETRRLLWKRATRFHQEWIAQSRSGTPRATQASVEEDLSTVPSDDDTAGYRILPKFADRASGSKNKGKNKKMSHGGTVIKS